MSERNYQQAFAATVVICVVLAVALGYVLLRHAQVVAAPEETSPIVAKGPDPASQASTAKPSSEVSPLTPIQISPQRLQAIGVKTAVVEMRIVNDELRVPGNVEVNEQKLAYVQTRFPGWVQQVFANATYQYVRKGEPLFTIYSQELVSTEQEYLLAKQSQKAFSTDEHGTVKDSDWLPQAAADRLRQFGVSSREIASLEKTGKVQRDDHGRLARFRIHHRTQRAPNLYVQPDTKLYTIADLSTVWVYANVFQTDVGHLKPGEPATVTVDAYPGRNFKGRIDQILPQVDTMTRTARVRLVFSNPGIVLKPGMYVNVESRSPTGPPTGNSSFRRPASGHAARLPSSILGDGYFEPREIEVGRQLDDHVVVLKGLQRRTYCQLGQFPGGFGIATAGCDGLICSSATRSRTGRRDERNR